MQRMRRWLTELDPEVISLLAVIALIAGLAKFGVSPEVLGLVGTLAAMGGVGALFGIVGRRTGASTEGRVEAIADLLTDAQLTFWWSEAARRGIIDPDFNDAAVWRGTGGLFPVTATWPDGWPRSSAADEALSGRDATLLVEELERRRSRLTVLGAGGAGKTSAMVAVFLQALRRRKTAPADAKPPVPVWVSLAGWDPYRVSLADWVATTIHRDYPGLLEDQRRLGRNPIEALWDADRPVGGRVMLFLDGLDELGVRVTGPDRDPLGRALASLDDATRGLATVLTCRTSEFERAARSAEYTAPHVRPRRNAAVLTITPCTLQQAREFLLDGHGPDVLPAWRRFVDALDARGDDLREVWNNPLSLSLVKGGFQGPNRDPNLLLADLPAAGFVPAQDVLGPLLDNLLRANYPNEEDRDHAETWLSWIAARSEAVTDFAWWQIPAWLSPAERHRMLRLRARRAASTTLAVFVCGALAVAAAARLGLVAGFDRADGGATVGGLSARDVVSWPWPWQSWRSQLPGLEVADRVDLSVLAVVANPLLLTIAVGALAVSLVWVMVRMGGDLEHPLGGQPQRIVPAAPSRGTIRDLRGATGWRPLMAVAALLGGSIVVSRVSPGSSAAVILTALLPALVFSSVFLAAVVLLQSWSRPARAFAPWTAYADDRTTTRVVTAVVAAILPGSAVALSWWLSAGGSAPSLGDWVWIVCAGSIAAGAVHGVRLGAGLGCRTVLRLRPEFGAGYGARLALAQEVLRRRAAAPLDFRRLLNLVRARDEASGIGRPVLGVLRLIGARYEFRHPTLRSYLLARHPQGSAGPPPRTRPRWRAIVVEGSAFIAALLLVSTITGAGSFLSTRAPCAHRSGAWPEIESTVWLENGQCVGLLAPEDGTNWFSAPGDLAATDHDRLTVALEMIAAGNRAAAREPADRVEDIVFFSPLSRTPGRAEQQTINGLAQLEGAARAQADINASAGGRKVRLLVANAGNQFAAGVSVARRISRLPNLSAVIGISQSRSVTRSALAELVPGVPIVAASVNGTRMRDGGLGDDGAPPLPDFVGVAPSDAEVARVMARSLHNDPARFTRAVIISDSDDVYYADELENDLRRELARAGTVDVEVLELREHPRGDSDTPASVAARVCEAGESTATLFAGRADQLISLIDAIRARGDRACAATARPSGITIIGGPGALVALAEGHADRSDEPWLRLRFYSLVRPGTATQPLRDLAIDSDRATGYTSLQHAHLLLAGPGRGDLPNRSPRYRIPVDIDPADGHNRRTTVYLCSNTAVARCEDGGHPGAPLRASPGRYRIDGTVAFLPWGAAATVVCRWREPVDGDEWFGVRVGTSAGYVPGADLRPADRPVTRAVPVCSGAAAGS